jgi:hypothetical protein
MSEYEAIIRYDGPALVDHKMDIEDIAPALMALADLCKRANAMANDDRASVRLFIDMDVEQHCAQFKLQIVQTVFETMKSLLDDPRVTTAKTILEWVGLVGGVGGSSVGLFKLLKLLNGRKVDSVKLSVSDGQNVTHIHAGGDVFVVHPNVAKLMADPVAVRKAKEVVRPATKAGYETVEFDDGKTVVEKFTKQDAILMEAVPAIDGPATIETHIPESTIQAKVKIRKAVYVGTGKWTIQYDKSRDMAMEDESWLADFQSNKTQAPPGSFLSVEMKVSAIKLDKAGEPIEEPEYSITKVFGVEKPPEQTSLL